jgi:hypothetical protein
MKDRNKTAAPAAAAGQAVKEKIFSIIKKAFEEGITDGRRMLWLDFAPNIAVVRKEDGYVAWLWRDCIAVKIILDNDFNVVGFDVET